MNHKKITCYHIICTVLRINIQQLMGNTVLDISDVLFKQVRFHMHFAIICTSFETKKHLRLDKIMHDF